MERSIFKQVFEFNLVKSGMRSKMHILQLTTFEIESFDFLNVIEMDVGKRVKTTFVKN